MEESKVNEENVDYSDIIEHAMLEFYKSLEDNEASCSSKRGTDDDYARVKVDKSEATNDNVTTAKSIDGTSSCTRSCVSNRVTFPFLLHEILAKKEYQHIVQWRQDGRSFMILNPDELAKSICPVYFKHSSYRSFLRQVNFWGFERINSALDSLWYAHEAFLRDYPKRANQMVRRKPLKSCKTVGQQSAEILGIYTLSSLYGAGTIPVRNSTSTTQTSNIYKDGNTEKLPITVQSPSSTSGVVADHVDGGLNSLNDLIQRQQQRLHLSTNNLLGRAAPTLPSTATSLQQRRRYLSPCYQDDTDNTPS